MLSDEADLRKHAQETANLGFKRPQLMEHPEVEEVLGTWLLQAQVKGVKITGDVLRAKAKRFVEILDIDSKEFLSLSNRWLDKFKARHQFKHYRFHGEAGSVAEVDVKMEQARLQEITKGYTRKDTFNMDETGVNDWMPPDHSLNTHQLSGKKADKH